MQDQKDYILWLCSWYPNKLKPYEGDFVQRHAQAVAQHKRLIVINICHDKWAKVTKTVLMDKSEKPNLTEFTLYYHSYSSIKKLDKVLMMVRFLKKGKELLQNIFETYGKPRFTHVHIIMNMGMLANWLYTTYNIPYVLSEQWVAYLPEAKPNFIDFNFWSKQQWFKITNSAKGITVVSKYLGNAIQKLNPAIETVRIPNVVDNRIFYPELNVKTNESGKIRFLHISTGDYQKNLIDILAAADLLQARNKNFELVLVLPEEESKKLNLQNRAYIKLEIERPQSELVKLFWETDAFILYSRYETFGCVVIEANATGLPVIAADIPVLQEIITDGKNGILVDGESPAALALSMETMIDRNMIFHKKDISQAALEQFSYFKIAGQFLAYYKDTGLLNE